MRKSLDRKSLASLVTLGHKLNNSEFENKKAQRKQARAAELRDPVSFRAMQALKQK